MSNSIRNDACIVLDSLSKNLTDLKLVDSDDEVLKDIAQSIFCFNDTLKILSNFMIDLMHKENGIGLAAPQIGLSIRLVVIDIVERNDDEPRMRVELDGKLISDLSSIMPMTLINPEIREVSAECEIGREGCLSVPDVFKEVKRPSRIIVSFFDIYGKRHIIEANGLLSRCMQHEVDHLDGILFTDRAKDENLKK